MPIAVFEQISDRPTPLYASVYQTANRILDEIAFRTAGSLQGDGFYSLPVPASQVLDKKNWYGAISHKAVGRMAGLGWQGKSLLLVNPRYGPRIRLVTVLTDAQLKIDGPKESLREVYAVPRCLSGRGYQGCWHKRQLQESRQGHPSFALCGKTRG